MSNGEQRGTTARKVDMHIAYSINLVDIVKYLAN
jgi:hypothetical protein